MSASPQSAPQPAPSRSMFCKGKVVFVGDAAVGKTSIIEYFRNNLTDEQEPTIAAKSQNAVVDYNGTKVSLNLWDTAGQEEYHCLVPIYVRLSQVAVIVFDLSCQQSFDSISEWLSFLSSGSDDIPHKFLVGNKLDLQRVVPEGAAEELARAHGLRLFYTSAKSGQNIDFLFYGIAEAVESSVEVTQCSVKFTQDRKKEEAKQNCQC